MIEAFEIGVSLALETNEAQMALSDLDRQLSGLDQTFSQAQTRVSGLQASMAGLSGSEVSSRVDSLQTLREQLRRAEIPTLQPSGESAGDPVVPEPATNGPMLWGLPNPSRQKEMDAGTGSVEENFRSTVPAGHAWTGAESPNGNFTRAVVQTPAEGFAKSEDGVFASEFSGIFNRLEGALAEVARTESRNGGYLDLSSSEAVERGALERGAHTGLSNQMPRPMVADGGSEMASSHLVRRGSALQAGHDDVNQSLVRRDYTQLPGPAWGLGRLVEARAGAANASVADARSLDPGSGAAGIFGPWPAELSRVMTSARTAMPAVAEDQTDRVTEQTAVVPLLPPLAMQSEIRPRPGDYGDAIFGLPSAGAVVPPTFSPSFGTAGRTTQGSGTGEQANLAGRSPSDEQNQTSGDKSFVVHTNVQIDGEVIARAVSERIIASMNGPLAGSGGFDPRRSYTPVES